MNRLRYILPASVIMLWAALALPAWASSLPDFTSLVEQQGPAVVNISARQTTRAHPFPFPGLDENDPMFEFFRRFIPQLPGAPGAERESRSLGSGFIISADGYILTNAHVVEDAKEILVRLVDRREFHATVVGTDARTDVAVIKIDASALPVVVLGDPDRLKVGEWVLAIGSPFGFEHTVTAGIVSAKGRNLPDENFVPFIQTDVAINPGNSGGPLFNLRGEVVGINSQIYSQTGGFMGLSFAIPIDVAMEVQRQLRETGRVQRGRIGVGIQELTRALAETFGLESPEGALVSSVDPEGPAARAGVTVGDVIVAFDGKAVTSSRELPRIVAQSRPGSKATITVVRDGRSVDLQVVLGEWRDEAGPKVEEAPVQKVDPNRLGLILSMPADAQTEGLVVDRAEGSAARAGIEVGDRILAVVTGGRQIRPGTVEAFEKLVAGMKDGQAVTLLIARGPNTMFLSLRVGE
jgi:serine protease Do